MKMDIGEFKLEYADASKYYIGLFIDVVRNMSLSDEVIDGKDNYFFRLANRSNLELSNRLIFIKYSSGEVIAHNMYEIYFNNRNTGYGIFFEKVLDIWINIYDYEVLENIHLNYKEEVEGWVIFNENRKD